MRERGVGEEVERLVMRLVKEKIKVKR